MGALSYFDLNKRFARSQRMTARVLFSRTRDATAADSNQEQQPRKMALWEQLLMYACVLAGVLFSSAVSELKAGRLDNLKLSIATVVVSGIVAFLIVPVAFEKLGVKTDSPLLVRMGLFIQQGVFWQVIMGALGKAAGA
jgi:hypothetical protein